MENQKQINILANTVGDLLYALDKDLIQGPFYAGLRVSCASNIDEIDENVISYIKR